MSRMTRPRSTGTRFVGACVCALCALLAAAGGMCPFNPDPVAMSDDPGIEVLLAPSPRLPIGFYDYFGSLKTPGEARELVIDAGLDPDDPSHYARIGLVHITEELIERGRDLFNTQSLGDPFTLNNILSLGGAFGMTTVETAFASFDPVQDPNGALAFFRELVMTALLRPKVATTNLQVTLSRELILGTQTMPAGTVIDVGADVAAGALLPVGFAGGTFSCALCHSSVDLASGQEIVGAPNLDLNIRLIIALSPNSAASFLKLNESDFHPMDPKFPKTGRRIIDSQGNTVQLPDPMALEEAVDDFLLTVPPGVFDAANDFTSAPTRIPDSWVFGEGGMGWDGGFNVGPFGGAASFSNAVHSLEINFLSAFHFTDFTVGLDPEIYLGVILQNAADPAIRIPDDVRPSEWLAANAPGAERSVLIELSTFPDPTQFSLNSLIFSPPGENFMSDVNALAAFQASLTVPPNKTPENRAALASGSVTRGADVFRRASCTECHPAPFFTNRRIISNEIIQANSARGIARRPLEGRLVESMLPGFDQPVPLPDDPPMNVVPPNEFASDTVSLPPGFDPDYGAYKAAGLLGVYLKAPYLHDAGVAVGSDAIRVHDDGSWEIVDAQRIGVTGTLKASGPISAAHSLRALLDRDLRAVVTANNQADPDLVRTHTEGVGHEFFVDPAAGFTYEEQTELISFLLALDDDPGRF